MTKTDTNINGTAPTQAEKLNDTGTPIKPAGWLTLLLAECEHVDGYGTRAPALNTLRQAGLELPALLARVADLEAALRELVEIHDESTKLGGCGFYAAAEEVGMDLQMEAVRAALAGKGSK